MTKFVFIYHAPAAPSDAPAPSEEQMQEVMGAWMSWSDKVGSGMVDFGTPLGSGVRVTADGTSTETHDVVGYTIIEAEDAAAALELAQAHPHLNMPGGCSIEIHEAQPIPGM